MDGIFTLVFDTMFDIGSLAFRPVMEVTHTEVCFFQYG